MTREETLKEIREAQNAGNRALVSLKNARRVLNSAGNWGLVDIFGGNFFAGLMKHSKLSEVNRQMEQARYEIQSFQKELGDINVSGSFGVNISDLNNWQRQIGG